MHKVKRRLERTLKNKANYILIGFIVIVLAAAIFFFYNKFSEFTFEDGFKELKKIDEKYGVDFKNELLNGTITSNSRIIIGLAIDPDNANDIINDIEKFEEKIKKMPNSKDAEALLTFTKIRKNMLNSERYFQLASNIGNIGLTTDKSGFSCSEASYIINTAVYYNMSWSYGINALSQIDDLLYQHRDVPNLRSLVGINENKTKFYKSPLGFASDITKSNLNSLKVLCNIEVNFDKSLRGKKA